MADPLGLLVTPVAVNSSGVLRALQAGLSDELLVARNATTPFEGVGGSVRYDNTSLPAGSSNQVGLSVPGGQRYQIDSLSFAYTGTVAGVILRPSIIVGGTAIPFDEVSPPVSGKLYAVYCSILVEQNIDVGVRVSGATLNDDILIVINYRRLK